MYMLEKAQGIKWFIETMEYAGSQHIRTGATMLSINTCCIQIKVEKICTRNVQSVHNYARFMSTKLTGAAEEQMVVSLVQVKGVQPQPHLLWIIHSYFLVQGIELGPMCIRLGTFP